MKRIIYSEIDGNSTKFYALVALLGVFVLSALVPAYYMEHHGHYVTSMNNQIVWGMPHVFAIFGLWDHLGCQTAQHVNHPVSTQDQNAIQILSARH